MHVTNLPYLCLLQCRLHRKQGRVKVCTEVKTIEGVEIMEVTVQDSGAGLSAENLGRLFGEGVQFNANGLQGGGGSGLGLFITKGACT